MHWTFSEGFIVEDKRHKLTLERFVSSPQICDDNYRVYGLTHMRCDHRLLTGDVTFIRKRRVPYGMRSGGTAYWQSTEVSVPPFRGQFVDPPSQIGNCSLGRTR